MAKILKFKRGNTAKNNAYTGSAGELTVDTTKKTVVVHDGVTTGGSVLATDVTVSTHTSRVDNPHSVSKTQVGLGNVLNVDSTNPNNIVQDSTHRFVTDSDKTNWNGKINATEKAVANGVATLDVNGKVVLTQIPDSVLGQLEYMGTYSFSGGMPTATQKGQYWIASADGNGYITGDWAVWNGTSFDKVDNTDAVATVAGRTGNVVLTKNDVGLNNVDNTSDINKPISTATQTALNTKVDTTTNQTIAGTKTFSSTIAGSINGNSASATKLQTARTINGVSFDGSTNITVDVSDSTAVKLTGDQTIAGVKTFSSNIVGNITGNAGTATKLSTTRANYKDTTDSVVAGELMWKKYGNNHTIIDASNAKAPNETAIDAANPNYPWSTGYPTLMGWNGSSTHGVRVDSARVADSCGNAANADKLIDKNWYWSGQDGQPYWLWGGSDGTNMYVYNPVNFNVNYANTAGVANNAIGYGQTWQNVTASRVLGTTYTNSTGKPIMVFVTKSNITNDRWEFYINGVSIGYINGYGTYNSTSIIIPNGSTYMADTLAGILTKWVELR